jgi:16S rRNA (guanine(966)-N(2))-methyltransferase RsmD
MRLISGKYKGKRIDPPASLRARPTTDFAREGLFSMITHLMDLKGTHVLDLFAGTGIIGFECLSRGSASVKAIDIDEKAIRFMRDTASMLGEKNHHPYRTDAVRVFKKDEQYHLVFADPPYGHKDTLKIPELAAPIIHKGGLLVVEHGGEAGMENFSNFSETRAYGRVHFSFYRF